MSDPETLDEKLERIRDAIAIGHTAIYQKVEEREGVGMVAALHCLDDLREHVDSQAARIAALESRATRAEGERDELHAARIAYASEFPPGEDGEPDVGAVHENIRALKRERDELRHEALDVHREALDLRKQLRGALDTIITARALLGECVEALQVATTPLHADRERVREALSRSRAHLAGQDVGRVIDDAQAFAICVGTWRRMEQCPADQARASVAELVTGRRPARAWSYADEAALALADEIGLPKERALGLIPSTEKTP